MKNIKDWTVLIYANGNNELEPEIWKAKLDLEGAASAENINVVMQMGREGRKLSEIMRPNEYLPIEEEDWCGVRRYYLSGSKSTLVSDLGRANMADPHTLYDFIKWGVENYPSKHRMLIIEGHGLFIAIMTDFSQDVPYMMGMPQMCRAVNTALRDVGVNLDILVLDACYMNSVELAYELGKERDCPVKYLLTYIKKGPLSGLPNEKIIETLQQNSGMLSIAPVMREIIDRIDMDLIAIEINHGKLKKIKGLINKLAYSYLTSKEFMKIKPSCLINSPDESCPWYNYALDYKKSLEEITVYYKASRPDSLTLIDIAVTELHLANKSLDYLALIYFNLSFSRNNYWPYILANRPLDKELNPGLLNLNMPQRPVIMHPDTVGKLIWSLDTSLTREEINEIRDKVFLYKGWNYNNIVSRLSKELETILGRLR